MATAADERPPLSRCDVPSVQHRSELKTQQQLDAFDRPELQIWLDEFQHGGRDHHRRESEAAMHERIELSQRLKTVLFKADCLKRG